MKTVQYRQTVSQRSALFSEGSLVMRLLDALKQAGRSGVIARQGRTDVIVVRSLNAGNGAAVLVQVADDQIGNWEPTEEDLATKDWLVVAKSSWSHR